MYFAILIKADTIAFNLPETGGILGYGKPAYCPRLSQQGTDTLIVTNEVNQSDDRSFRFAFVNLTGMIGYHWVSGHGNDFETTDMDLVEPPLK